MYVENVNKNVLLYNLCMEDFKLFNYSSLSNNTASKVLGDLLCLEENILLMEVGLLGKDHFIIH